MYLQLHSMAIAIVIKSRHLCTSEQPCMYLHLPVSETVAHLVLFGLSSAVNGRSETPCHEAARNGRGPHFKPQVALKML